MSAPRQPLPTRVYPPSAYDRFDSAKRNEWIYNLVSKIERGKRPSSPPQTSYAILDDEELRLQDPEQADELVDESMAADEGGDRFQYSETNGDEDTFHENDRMNADPAQHIVEGSDEELFADDEGVEYGQAAAPNIYIEEDEEYAGSFGDGIARGDPYAQFDVGKQTDVISIGSSDDEEQEEEETEEEEEDDDAEDDDENEEEEEAEEEEGEGDYDEDAQQDHGEYYEDNNYQLQTGTDAFFDGEGYEIEARPSSSMVLPSTEVVDGDNGSRVMVIDDNEDDDWEVYSAGASRDRAQRTYRYGDAVITDEEDEAVEEVEEAKMMHQDEEEEGQEDKEDEEYDESEGDEEEDGDIQGETGDEEEESDEDEDDQYRDQDDNAVDGESRNDGMLDDRVYPPAEIVFADEDDRLSPLENGMSWTQEGNGSSRPQFGSELLSPPFGEDSGISNTLYSGGLAIANEFEASQAYASNDPLAMMSHNTDGDVDADLQAIISTAIANATDFNAQRDLYPQIPVDDAPILDQAPSRGAIEDDMIDPALTETLEASDRTGQEVYPPLPPSRIDLSHSAQGYAGVVDNAADGLEPQEASYYPPWSAGTSVGAVADTGATDLGSEDPMNTTVSTGDIPDRKEPPASTISSGQTAATVADEDAVMTESTTPDVYDAFAKQEGQSPEDEAQVRRDDPGLETGYLFDVATPDPRSPSHISIPLDDVLVEDIEERSTVDFSGIVRAALAEISEPPSSAPRTPVMDFDIEIIEFAESTTQNSEAPSEQRGHTADVLDYAASLTPQSTSSDEEHDVAANEVDAHMYQTPLSEQAIGTQASDAMRESELSLVQDEAVDDTDVTVQITQVPESEVQSIPNKTTIITIAEDTAASNGMKQGIAGISPSDTETRSIQAAEDRIDLEEETSFADESRHDSIQTSPLMPVPVLLRTPATTPPIDSIPDEDARVYTPESSAEGHATPDSSNMPPDSNSSAPPATALHLDETVPRSTPRSHEPSEEPSRTPRDSERLPSAEPTEIDPAESRDSTELLKDQEMSKVPDKSGDVVEQEPEVSSADTPQQAKDISDSRTSSAQGSNASPETLLQDSVDAYMGPSDFGDSGSLSTTRPVHTIPHTEEQDMEGSSAQDLPAATEDEPPKRPMLQTSESVRLRHMHGRQHAGVDRETNTKSHRRTRSGQAAASSSTPPVTRSHCFYRKLKLVEDDLSALVLVPQCTLYEYERLEMETSEDLGEASDEEETLAGQMAMTLDEPLLHPRLALKLHRIVGNDIVEEGHCFLLAAEPNSLATAVHADEFAMTPKRSASKRPSAEPGIVIDDEVSGTDSPARHTRSSRRLSVPAGALNKVAVSSPIKTPRRSIRRLTRSVSQVTDEEAGPSESVGNNAGALASLPPSGMAGDIKEEEEQEVVDMDADNEEAAEDVKPDPEAGAESSSTEGTPEITSKPNGRLTRAAAARKAEVDAASSVQVGNDDLEEIVASTATAGEDDVLKKAPSDEDTEEKAMPESSATQPMETRSRTGKSGKIGNRSQREDEAPYRIPEEETIEATRDDDQVCDSPKATSTRKRKARLSSDQAMAEEAGGVTVSVERRETRSTKRRAVATKSVDDGQDGQTVGTQPQPSSEEADVDTSISATKPSRGWFSSLWRR